MSLLKSLHTLGKSPKARPSLLSSISLDTLEPVAPAEEWRPVDKGAPVKDSKDLQRILALPRRPFTTSAEDSDFERALRKPGSDARLRPVQIAALLEAKRTGGLFAPIEVGGGKTLISLLLPMVLESKVSVLLIPPTLKRQLLDTDVKFWEQHFKLPNIAGGDTMIPGRPLLYVLTYSALQQPKNSDLLDRIAPDLIIADEAHCLKNRSSSRTKRVKRRFDAYPATRGGFMSGTMTSTSIKDWTHLAAWALKGGSPGPLNFGTVLEWSGALDPGARFPSPAGALRAFCEGAEKLRDGYRRRVLETPGVVVVTEPTFTLPLHIKRRDPGAIPPNVQEVLNRTAEERTRPDGEILASALDYATCMQTLSYGFFYRWIFPRGEPEPLIKEWFLRRQNWNRELREKLKRDAVFMDSPKNCIMAVKRHRADYTGHLPKWNSVFWDAWEEIKDQVYYESEAVWIDDFLLRDATEWLESHVGIAWYDCAPFGERLAEMSGRPFFGPGDAANEAIRLESGERSIIASMRSHCTGKNLQMFNKNLVTNVPSSGKQWEQLVGRTHRFGQKAEEVNVSLYMHTPALVEAFRKAMERSQYMGDSWGGASKLILATKQFDGNGPVKEHRLRGANAVRELVARANSK